MLLVTQFLAGLFATIVGIALLKHIRDKAPLTSYFLNPSKTIGVPGFPIAGIFFGFTSLFAGLAIFFNVSTFYPKGFTGLFIDYALLVIPFTASVGIVLVLYFWFKRFRRFA
ncbi:MAG: hypothetical protein OH338_00690 [Candidatus Parvarchaeota archaeon]|nr:hypothetical protein [Candidatus Parvarchaeota archaeon]MCW1294374.1 hypothetical protein [Candidatus Parvarchaeum tengchongense]MCW1295265.1 hypothetical protein [Candidatus Parvarchaeum tengchongense]MCW1311932.1 hypothetical protein [Candidatus Parvarchaeum tengchongense]